MNQSNVYRITKKCSCWLALIFVTDQRLKKPNLMVFFIASVFVLVRKVNKGQKGQMN